MQRGEGKMIFVHTYETLCKGEKDHYQFYEYEQNGMVISDSQELPIAIMLPKKDRGNLNNYMLGAIRNFFNALGVPAHIRHNSTLSFDELDFG